MPTLTRRIQITPQTPDDNTEKKKEMDRVYNYLRNGMEVQAIMMNQCISAIYTATMRGADKNEIKQIYEMCQRKPTSKKGSYYDFDISKFPTGLPIAGGIPRMVKQAFDTSCKNGLLYGKVSLPTFKKTTPLYIHNRYVTIRKNSRNDTGFYHDYADDTEFEEALMTDRNPKLHIKFAHGITFNVILGNVKKSRLLRDTLVRCFTGEYRIADSKIQIKDNKIYLLLAVNTPEYSDEQLDESITVGVDLGLATPAVCALNGDLREVCYIGSRDEFISKRTHIDAMKRAAQAACKYSKGGHGRAKKMARYERAKKNERNFVRQYNHYVSKEVTNFARKHHAKYINIEDLSGFSKQEKNSWVLRNWSYYELQSMIKYKAELYGIIVRTVRPAYTSQVCSVCGERGERPDQKTFICHNKNCECHKLYFVEKYNKEIFNADFNAARNISMSAFLSDDYNDISAITFADAINGLTTRDKEYHHCIITANASEKNAIIYILCDDGKWHDFKYEEIKDIIDYRLKEKKEKDIKKAA